MPTGIWAVFPHVNATLNASAFVCIVAGLIAIKRKKVELHKRCMLTAAVLSALFLTCYLIYHFAVHSVPYRGEGALRTVYFTILFSHIVLAIVQVPLIVITILHGLRGRLDKHKRIAKITAPIWIYVSVTGVVVYLMLYQL